MRPVRIPEAFDHPDFLYEGKHDGFRALASVQDGECQLVAERHHFNAWPPLSDEIADAVRQS